MIKYPNGNNFLIKDTKSTKRHILTAANRGMGLEEDINTSNAFYIDQGIALIHKRTTPIKVVKVNYDNGAKIVEAYFEKQSTTDYNGVYKGKYIDFEAKSTKNENSFPLSNISLHQIKHLENVNKQKGITFFIIEFSSKNEIYLIDGSYIISFYYHGDRKSIPYEIIKQKGSLITQGITPRLDYIKIVEDKYFK